MKTIPVFVLVLFSTIVSAQLQKGNYLLGGSLSIISSKNDQLSSPPNSRWTSLGITPSGGYFISNKLVIGMDAGFSYGGIYIPGPGEYNDKNYGYSITPFLRNYISLGDKIALFIHSSLGVNYSKTKNIEPGYNPDGTPGYYSRHYNFVTGTVSAYLGLAYFISSKWSIESSFASLQYNHLLKQSRLSIQPNDNFNIGYGLSSLDFGVTYYINR